MTVYETITAINGNKVKRVKSSIFYWMGSITFAIGIYLVSVEEVGIGTTLILMVAPCLFLYPAIRFLFGGKDSVAAVLTTVVVEEVLKSAIGNALTENKKRRKKR